MPAWRALLLAAAVPWVSFSSCACTPAKNYLDPERPRFAGQFARDPSAFDDTLTVVSFNIKFAKEIALVIREFSADARLRQADVLLLQEMDSAGVEIIARGLGYDYVYYPATRHPQSGKDFGNAVLSKWRIKQDQKILLPYEAPGNKTRRIAVAARLAVADREILAASVHTATFVQGEEKQLQQAGAVLHQLAPDDGCVIIGGDFNTLVPGSAEATQSIFARRGFTHASFGTGATARFCPVGFTLDHIFVRGMRVVAAGRVHASRASDHVPIWVKVVL